MTGSANATHDVIRETAVAGQFYPGDAETLASTVDGFLTIAKQNKTSNTSETDHWPKAIIAPHAGYVYSGPVAASVYADLAPARGKISRIVLLGPSHRVAFRGMAVPSVSAFATPLGPVALDHEALAHLANMSPVLVSDEAHAEEHSLEVHLPFLQRVLDDFKLVPVCVGDAPPDDVAEVLETLWGGAETLIVISADLSHYHSYDEACLLD